MGGRKSQERLQLHGGPGTQGLRSPFSGARSLVAATWTRDSPDGAANASARVAMAAMRPRSAAPRDSLCWFSLGVPAAATLTSQFERRCNTCAAPCADGEPGRATACAPHGAAGSGLFAQYMPGPGVRLRPGAARVRVSASEHLYGSARAAPDCSPVLLRLTRAILLEVTAAAQVRRWADHGVGPGNVQALVLVACARSNRARGGAAQR